MQRGVRYHPDFIESREGLRGYARLALGGTDFARAVGVTELLAHRGQHRAVGLPDLLQAALAERHGVVLLHHDADFERIAAVTGQPMEWAVPRGSVS